MLILSLFASVAIWSILVALIFAVAGAGPTWVGLAVLTSALCLVAAWYRYAQVTTRNEVQAAIEARRTKTEANTPISR